MKNYINRWYIACLALVLCCLAAACSDEEGSVPVEVSFTAPGAFDMDCLDSCGSVVSSFELTSDGAWSVCSDKMWVKLSLQPDGDFYNDVQGGAGVHTVYVKVTNDARGFNASQATVSVMAGGKTQAVVTIEREGKEHTFALLSSEGVELDKIVIGTDATVWVAPDTNFECSVLSCPEWIAEPEALSGGYTLNVGQSFVPFNSEGVVTFGNIDGSIVYDVPVEYVGMDASIMNIEGDYTPWGWKVSLDGKTFVQEASSAAGDDVETLVEDELLCYATCLNYDYRFVPVKVENDSLSIMDTDESWIFAAQDVDDPARVSVSVAPLESGRREGYLFAAPSSVYDNFIDSLTSSSDIDAFVDSNLSYVVFEIEQRDLESTDGFIITDSRGTRVECTTEGEYYEWLCSEFKITDLTTCNLVPGQSYTIDTKFNASDWEGNFAITDLKHTNQRLKLWGNPKPECGADGIYRLTITVPETLDKTIVLRLYTPQIVNLKAIVIRPATK